MLRAIVDAKGHLERIKRFDVRGFRRNEHCFREMKPFGIIPSEQTLNDPIDVYATDQAFWASAWHPPVPSRDAASSAAEISRFSRLPLGCR